MDSDVGSSLALRRHRPFSPFLYLSSPFVPFIDLLQVCLLFLGFLSSSFVHGCASCHYCHIQTCWLLFLTCSPAPSVTAALVPDLTFEGCVCIALSRSPKTAVLSTSLGCSELYSASSEANRLLSEDPKTNHLSTPLPFTVAKPDACSPFHSKTDSGDKRLNFGFIDTLWLRYGNIGVQSLLLGTASAIPPNLVKRFYCYAGVKVARASSSNSLSTVNYSGRERSSSPSSFSQERIFPPQSLLLRGDLLPVLKIRKIYLYPSRLLSYVKVRLGPVDATILIGLRVEVLG
ncbi:hypothetical protein HID58_095492 [Brassica napus]|uniref:Uncharacterized protein n=1 Tax=Brassica napus TaxID=3708 RepID=A0ABQ7X3C6_BRANA|nr:hypothetical protein HID58_095492 [Brassica napus]